MGEKYIKGNTPLGDKKGIALDRDSDARDISDRAKRLEKKTRGGRLAQILKLGKGASGRR